MKVLRRILVSCSLLAATAAEAAPAAAPKAEKPAALLRKALAAGLPGGATGNARILALIGDRGVVIRSKGVASVTRVSAGAYRVTPADKTPKLETIVPSVSVDFAGSIQADALAQINTTRFLCP